MRQASAATPALLALALVLALSVQPATGRSAPGSGLERTQGMLSGRIADKAGAPLAGVAVKLFEEGFLLHETTSGADGAYELKVDYLPDIDWTVMVWFVPPQPELLPEILILRESLKSKDLDLWSSCLPRIDLRPGMSFDAVLLDEEAKLGQMSELDCMKGDGR